MKYPMETVEVDPDYLARAVRDMRLQTEAGWNQLRELVEPIAVEAGTTSGEALMGFSYHNIKKMLNPSDKDACWPVKLPSIVARAIYDGCRININGAETQEFFDQLQDSIRFELTAVPANVHPEDWFTYTLKNLKIGFDEMPPIQIKAPNDTLESLHIGFTETALHIDAIGSTPLNANRFSGEVRADDPIDAEDEQIGYTGHFYMRYLSSQPLRWRFWPKEGAAVLRGTVEVEDDLARVDVRTGTKLTAIISAPARGMIVRVPDEDGDLRTSLSHTEEHRRKMCAAVVRKDLQTGPSHYEILRYPLPKERPSK